MEKRITTVDLGELAISAARFFAGDVYAAATQIWKFRRVIAGILIAAFLFIIIIGVLIVSLPVLVLKAIVPEPLQGFAILALDALWKAVSVVLDVVTWIFNAIGDVIEFFFGGPGTHEKVTDMNGDVLIDPVHVLIIYNVKYGKGYFDSEEIDEEKFEEIAKYFSEYTTGRTDDYQLTLNQIMEDNPYMSEDDAREIALTMYTETLHVDVINYSFEEILESDKLNLSEYQKTIALNMLEVYKENPGMYADVLNYGNLDLMDEISQELISAMLAQAPTINRVDIMSAANSVLDDVPYFWGGKSSAIGRDQEWAEWIDIGWDSTKLKRVTSPGSSSTGQMRPYGLDCSGFVAWAYYNAGFEELLDGGTSWQWSRSYTIPESELQPGDLAFENPGSMQNNHVGIFAGRDTSGNNLYIHSAPYISSTTNHNGVTKDNYSRFRFFRRVIVNFN